MQAGEINEREAIELRRINGQVASLEFYSQMFSMPIECSLKDLEDVPMLIIHGEKDTLISIAHAELYAKKRKDSKAETLFIRLPYGDHDFTYNEERQAAILETARWFQKTLGIL